MARHPDAVHALSENRRQLDADEREVLAELRAGEVDRAVDWYVREQRVHAVPERDEALQAAVDAWAADVAAGRETGLYAWRRANVAELNALARHWMADSGRLSGPELVLSDGASYRAGDRVVALVPGADGALVTSQRATVEAVDLARGTLTLRTSDDRKVCLGAEGAGTDRLGYAYATTVHRSQGATTARTHLFADGGGRELAYVAMSRAKEVTHVWTVADDRGQAREDLVREWSSERRPTWAIDTGLPGPGELDRATLAVLPRERQGTRHRSRRGTDSARRRRGPGRPASRPKAQARGGHCRARWATPTTCRPGGRDGRVRDRPKQARLSGTFVLPAWSYGALSMLPSTVAAGGTATAPGAVCQP